MPRRKWTYPAVCEGGADPVQGGQALIGRHSMQRRRLGQLEVSAIGLGCGTMTPFYGEPDRAAGIATIRRAREVGVDLLDTADGYGRGRNEELVAEAAREHRGDYVIASKFGNLGLLGDPRFADGRPEYVRETCEKRLGRSRPTSSTSITSIESIRPFR